MTAVQAPRNRRYELLDRVGLQPMLRPRVRAILDAEITRAEARSRGSLEVLDAGCGHTSPLAPFRRRIDRLVGVDLHAPAQPIPYLDEFAVVDLCSPTASLGDGRFDLILSNFTLEHFTDPPVALSNLHRWLRPDGTLVVTTVNRRNPFVAAYLALPPRLRNRLQPYVKASAADAHPLVGRCNAVPAIRRELRAVGFEWIEVETVPHLARAWAHRLPAFALGTIGDLMTRSMPGRRSTIIVTARR